jgi:hypothetical protein
MFSLASLFIKNIFFGSIVVSISACHSKEQLAGGRGSIPRQRVKSTIFFFRLVGVVVWKEQFFAPRCISAELDLCSAQYHFALCFPLGLSFLHSTYCMTLELDSVGAFCVSPT